MRPLPIWFAAVAGLAMASSLAAQDSTIRRLPVVVTVTRDVGRSPLDLPYAISSLRPDSVVRGQTHTFVEQTLALLPGVTVANRNNPSQDTRISIRGFGARSQFGARSIRILRDGMPLTLPDGQTPVDYLDLESVGRVEAIRGAASALYGNASGGVLDLRSIDPPNVPLAVQFRSFAGSSGSPGPQAGCQVRVASCRYAGLLAGRTGPVAYEGNIGHTENHGFRHFGEQKLTNAFMRSTADLGGTTLTLLGMGLDMPVALNPGALSRTQFEDDPSRADTLSVQKRARKQVHQVQLGLSARHALLDGEVTGQVYGGTRTLFNPQTFTIVGIDRRQQGAGVRATVPFVSGGVTNRVSVGADAQWLNDARKNWANCDNVTRATTTCTTPGVEKGALSLDQRELVSSVGPFVRDELEVGRFRGTLGLRADQVTFQLRDHYLTDGRDDSGRRTMSAVSPMVGMAARLSPLHSVYANVAAAFETPTTTELGNQPNGTAGLNQELQPQLSTTFEVGAKGLALDRVQYDVALFDSEIHDELIPFATATSNGRTFYRNAGRTRRQGVEVALAGDAGPVSLATAYTLSHFRFRDFQTATAQLAGKAIPGIPEQQIQADATLHLSSAYLVLEGVGKTKVWANDANAAAAPGFVVLNARFGGTRTFGGPRLAPVIAVQNLLDKKYIGSVAINAAGASVDATKFYEPAPRLTWYIGFTAASSPW